MSQQKDDRIELEPIGHKGPIGSVADRRPHIPEPLPVTLVAVQDVHLVGAVEDEPALDDFYLRILQFEREQGGPRLVYRAENLRLIIDLVQRPVIRTSLRAVRIIVPSLLETEHKLMDAEMDYTRQRGLTPGDDMLVLLDPAGNWVELIEAPRVR